MRNDLRNLVRQTQRAAPSVCVWCLIKAHVFQTHILVCSKLLNSAFFPRSVQRIINALLCFPALLKYSGLVFWILFCIAPHISSINLMSAFLSAMLPPCQAAAWSGEVSFLSVVKDSCISPAAAYISYSHWCIIPFIPETYFQLLCSFYFWVFSVYQRAALRMFFLLKPGRTICSLVVWCLSESQHKQEMRNYFFPPTSWFFIHLFHGAAQLIIFLYYYFLISIMKTW